MARMLSRMGLVEGFGHVSARDREGGFAITSTAPMATATAAQVLVLDAAGEVRDGDPASCPLEAPLHSAIYSARPDVGAVCRTHSPHAAAWAARRLAPPLVHGLGGLAGDVAVHENSDLIADRRAGEDAARALGRADCLLLAANGAACCGEDLPAAAVRAWYLEERSAIADRATEAEPLSGEAATRRARHHPAEAARAWNWLQTRFGSSEPRTTTHPRRDR